MEPQSIMILIQISGHLKASGLGFVLYMARKNKKHAMPAKLPKIRA